MKGVYLAFLYFVLVITGASSPATAVAAGAKPSSCNGSIASCQLEDEFMMDSDTHRRFLQQGRHISYGALQPDRPVCDSGRGKPYVGNCVPARSGNPPSRGCNPYDRCRVG